MTWIKFNINNQSTWPEFQEKILVKTRFYKHDIAERRIYKKTNEDSYKKFWELQSINMLAEAEIVTHWHKLPRPPKD